MKRIIMIDDEGDKTDVAKYAVTLKSKPYGFAVGPGKPEKFLDLSKEGIFTDVDAFLDYVNYLKSGDSEAQSEQEEIVAFIIDQRIPPGDQLVKIFPDMKLGDNHDRTGEALLMHLDLYFQEEIIENPIEFFVLSQLPGQVLQPFRFLYLSKNLHTCEDNCRTIHLKIGS